MLNKEQRAPNVGKTKGDMMSDNTDKVFEALQMAEFLTNEIRMNGELRKDDLMNIKKYHQLMDEALQIKAKERAITRRLKLV